MGMDSIFILRWATIQIEPAMAEMKKEDKVNADRPCASSAAFG
jgi:hypothetical protein